jgi:hypothetical protein
MAVAGTTTTTSVAEAIYATILSKDVLRELRPANVMRRFLKKGVPGDSPSYDFLKIDPLVANSFALDPTLVETTVGVDGTAFTVRELQTDKATATGVNKGIMGAVGDVTQVISSINAKAELTGALGRTLKHKWEIDATALFPSLTNVTTAATVMLVSDFVKAIAALEQRDVTGNIVSVLHPKQLADMRADVQTKTAVIWGKDSGAPADFSHHSGEDWGPLFDIPMYATSVVATVGGVDRAGAMFVANEALGYLELIGPRVEVWRDGRALLDYVITNMDYGSCIIDQSRAQKILSDI